MGQFLSHAEAIFAGAPGIPAAMQRVARALIPRAADFCLIFLALDGHVRCAAVAHRTAEGQRLLRHLARVYRIRRDDPVSTVAHVLRTGRPKLRSEIHREPAVPRSDIKVFTLHQRLGPRSALVVPIGEAPNVMGAISLCYASSGRSYTTHDVAPARRLAALAASFLKKRALVIGGQSPAAVVPRRSLRLRARA